MLICCAFKNGEDPKILGILGYPINGYIYPLGIFVSFSSLIQIHRSGWCQPAKAVGDTNSLAFQRGQRILVTRTRVANKSRRC